MPTDKNVDSNKKIKISAQNPESCTSGHECKGHEKNHKHGPTCGHKTITHGDHTDYVVEGHLHHMHKDHCDHHGSAKVA